MSLLALQDAAASAPPFFTYTPNAPDVLGGWLICFFTLAVFSFLYKDNPFYKLAEHVFVGVGTAWFTMEYYNEGIRKPLVEYVDAAREQAVRIAALGPNASPEAVRELQTKLGGYPIDPSWAIGIRAGAIVLSIFLLVRLFKNDSWMPRWPLAIMVGVYAALKMTGEVQSKLVLQVAETMKSPFTSPVDGTPLAWDVQVGNVVFLVGLVCALTYFLFTFQRNKVVHGMARVGVITLMITFGSMFGFTVLGRIALLIERVSSLSDYSGPEYGLFGAGAALSPPYVAGAVIVATLVALSLAKPSRAD
ncbi:MAG: hypothetical protein H6825_06260 [Planctomycetes bacterium]|nr:hypothetical protein [Planctomycetota bacterium]